MTWKGRGIQAGLLLVIIPYSALISSLKCLTYALCPCGCGLHVHPVSMPQIKLQYDVSAKTWKLGNCGARHVSHTAKARLMNRRSHI